MCKLTDIEIGILIRKKEALQDEVCKLRAENEWYEKKLESILAMCDSIEENLLILINERLPETIATAKAEAIKEFAERFEDELGEEFFNHYPFVLTALDNLVKEMTENEGKE